MVRDATVGWRIEWDYWTSTILPRKWSNRQFWSFKQLFWLEFWFSWTLFSPKSAACLMHLTSFPMQRCCPTPFSHLWWRLILQDLQRRPCFAVFPARNTTCLAVVPEEKKKKAAFKSVILYVMSQNEPEKGRGHEKAFQISQSRFHNRYFLTAINQSINQSMKLSL